MPYTHLIFRTHAIIRMRQRQISVVDVHQVLETGEIIENYPDDTPYPSYLMLGWQRRRPLHVVAADNSEEQVTIIITVYEPDPARWEPGLRRRKQP